MINLFHAISQLKDKHECERFFKDLCTPQEVEEMQGRWLVCQMLAKGEKSYREISEEAGISLATITRVARFLRNEPYKGYKLMLKRLGVKDRD